MDLMVAREHNYPDKPLWKDKRYFGGQICAYDILSGNGTPGFDSEHFINTAGGEKLMDFLKITMLIGKEDADTVACWAERGVEKKLWDMETPELRWASYAPVEARSSNGKWPVIFAFTDRLLTDCIPYIESPLPCED